MSITYPPEMLPKPGSGEKAEVMVDEGSSITLNDYYDATYHLVGGSHLKFFNKSVQLKRGKTWIQSKGTKTNLALTTANGQVDYAKSEFITTFDTATSRSQFLVVTGDVEVSNILDRNMKYTVAAGTFTLIDPNVENGLPRTPTKVGLTSLNSALGEFKQLPEAIKETAVASRSIASTEEASEKKGQIIFVQTNRMPASVAGAAHNYFKKATKKPHKQVKSDLTPAPITFYGTSWDKVTPPHSERTPASIAPAPVVPRKIETPLNLDHEFTQSLKRETTDQPKFSKELEGLIKDLKSY